MGHYFAELERAEGFLQGFPREYSATARGLLPLRIQLGVRDRCTIEVWDLQACRPAAEAEEVRAGIDRLLGVPGAAAQLRHAPHLQQAIREYMEDQYAANRSLRQTLEGSPPARRPRRQARR